ncbi:uncharacterized protein DS421_5g170920 [Arachis hypogaea]|nr:uncharacterized protein DS421_5g170920 [Arachis hypogaea]
METTFIKVVRVTNRIILKRNRFIGSTHQGGLALPHEPSEDASPSPSSPPLHSAAAAAATTTTTSVTEMVDS